MTNSDKQFARLAEVDGLIFEAEMKITTLRRVIDQCETVRRDSGVHQEQLATMLDILSTRMECRKQILHAMDDNA